VSGWRTHGSRVVYENPWIRVREDDVTRPDGGAGIYGVVQVRNPSVFVVAVDDEDRVVLVRLFRYTTGAWSLEVPAGGSDGEEPLLAARRELLEEAGLVAGSWAEVGRMDALNGIADAPEHVFLARELAAADGAGGPGAVAERAEVSDAQAEEGIAEVLRVPFAQALAWVADGTIRDGETVAALAFAAIRMGRLG
jgi:8-oxo-dGTP pyrophosphatase MutT (NUDIX family)